MRSFLFTGTAPFRDSLPDAGNPTGCREGGKGKNPQNRRIFWAFVRKEEGPDRSGPSVTPQWVTTASPSGSARGRGGATSSASLQLMGSGARTSAILSTSDTVLAGT